MKQSFHEWKQAQIEKDSQDRGYGKILSRPGHKFTPLIPATEVQALVDDWLERGAIGETYAHELAKLISRGKYVMGPQQWALDFADHLIQAHGLTVERYSFAYSIQSWCEGNEDTYDEPEKHHE